LDYVFSPYSQSLPTMEHLRVHIITLATMLYSEKFSKMAKNQRQHWKQQGKKIIYEDWCTTFWWP
jgi:hypothetical protein